MPRLRETIPPALAGERLDRVVAMLTQLPRSDVAELLAGGEAALDGAVVRKPSRRVREGELLEVEVPDRRDPEPPRPDPRVAFEVVHADDDVVVVDKPAHLVVHPGAGQRDGTLIAGLLARFPDMAGLDTGDPERPGVVHRLDAGTSGLLVVARTAAAHAALVEQMARRTVERRYLALVLGRVDPVRGTIDAPIGRSQNDKTRMAVVAGGRQARTSYEVLETFERPVATSYLRCRLETGRTHQIRVHLAAIGHPVVGDDRYGGARPTLPLDRPFLHAAELAFDHPSTGRRISFTAPLPRALTDLLARLSTAPS